MPRHNGNTQPGVPRRWRGTPAQAAPTQADTYEDLALALVFSGRRTITILDHPRAAPRREGMR